MPRTLEVHAETRVQLDAESDGFRITPDGYLVAEPRVARTGVQRYLAKELGLTDVDPTTMVRIMRPDGEVFDRESLTSYAHRPVTMGHPESVSADNWKDVAVGHTGGEILKDGEFVRVPLVLMDADAVESVQSGDINELSLGYTMLLDYGDSGEGFDATARNIRANHLAVVRKARGGRNLRIGDEGEPMPQEMEVITVDGVDVEVVKPGKQVMERLIERQQRQVDDAQGKLQKASEKAGEQEDKYVRDVQTRDAKIQALEHEVRDAQPTPEQIAQLVSEHAKVRDAAMVIMGRDATLDGQSIEEMHRTVVAYKMGDAAKDMNAIQLGAAFDALRSVSMAGGTALRGSAMPLRDAVQAHMTTSDARDQAQRDYEESITGRRKVLYDGLRNGA